MCYQGRKNEDTFAKEATFLNDDAYIATGGDDGNLFIWETMTGRMVFKRKADRYVVNCVAPHPYVPILAT